MPLRGQWQKTLYSAKIPNFNITGLFLDDPQNIKSGRYNLGEENIFSIDRASKVKNQTKGIKK